MIGIGVICSVEITVCSDYQHLVFPLENTKAFASAVVIETQHVLVKPHLAPAKRACAFLHKRNVADSVFCYEISERFLPLYVKFREIHHDLKRTWSAACGVWLILKFHFHYFCLAVRIDRKPFYLGTLQPFGQVVFFFAGQTGDAATLLIIESFLAVAVYDIIDSALVPFLEDPDVFYLFSDI